MYCLEKKTRFVMPNVLGNCSFPVYTYRWKQVAISKDREALEEIMPEKDEHNYRITVVGGVENG